MDTHFREFRRAIFCPLPSPVSHRALASGAGRVRPTRAVGTHVWRLPGLPSVRGNPTPEETIVGPGSNSQIPGVLLREFCVMFPASVEMGAEGLNGSLTCALTRALYLRAPHRRACCTRAPTCALRIADASLIASSARAKTFPLLSLRLRLRLRSR